MRKLIRAIASILTIAGSINLGFIGFLNFDLIGTLVGANSIFQKIIYSIIGLAAIFTIIFTLHKTEKI